MTVREGFDLQRLVSTNASAAFNRSAGFEVVAAGAGEVELRMAWRDDLTQYAGHLHAGMIAALLDTACGFAAATVVGGVTASHFSMNCLETGRRPLLRRQRRHGTRRPPAGLCAGGTLRGKRARRDLAGCDR